MEASDPSHRRISVQGPIKKNKASFIVSARRTYIDVLVKPFIKKESQFYGSGYYFYDLNTKVNYKFSDKDRLYLSGYFGRDVFDFQQCTPLLQAPIFPGAIQPPLCAGTMYSTGNCLPIPRLCIMIIIFRSMPRKMIFTSTSLPASATGTPKSILIFIPLHAT